MPVIGQQLTGNAALARIKCLKKGIADAAETLEDHDDTMLGCTPGVQFPNLQDNQPCLLLSMDTTLPQWTPDANVVLQPFHRK